MRRPGLKSIYDQEREGMNEVNKTLYIPLYGKSKVSKQGIILNDSSAEKIWEEEGFTIHGRSKSKWLAYNMAMRARVFDDWTGRMLHQNENALVLHIGCGLDSRCMRVGSSYTRWIDCDLPDVITIRRKYFQESEKYQMMTLDASDSAQIGSLPDSETAIVVLEGLSMYLTNDQICNFLHALEIKYQNLQILMDVYTEFGARISKYKNPVNDVGVNILYGISDIRSVIRGLRIEPVAEHTFTPTALIDELPFAERFFFKLFFTGRLYRKIYRLYELEG